uniref:PQ-loop repeat-containing protein 1 n=1 Tax=Glossina pallidipes TaxID=7398 RepID=A0A1B0A4B6_GLOPL
MPKDSRQHPFSKRYELPLLVQSVVMNITMFLMIHLCVKVKRVNANKRERTFSGDDLRLPKATMTETDTAGSVSISTEAGAMKRVRSRHYLSDLDLKYFWNWTDFQSYLDFMLLVWAVGAAITYLMLSIDWFMETVGFVAVFTEAMLGAPQFVRNFKNKSTYGMSIHMVIMWTLGDMFKTGYFIARKAPSQFWICGTLQVSLDLAILLQVWVYRHNSKPRDFAPEEQQQQQQQQNHLNNTHSHSNNNSGSRNQSIPNTISSGSGDDHLLTANADDDHFQHLNYHAEYKNYHDNRAFQFYNNNTLSQKQKSATEASINETDSHVLDVVTVHCSSYQGKDLEGDKLSNTGQISNLRSYETRKRHNATQTPSGFDMWKHDLYCRSNHSHLSCCCHNHKRNVRGSAGDSYASHADRHSQDFCRLSPHTHSLHHHYPVLAGGTVSDCTYYNGKWSCGQCSRHKLSYSVGHHHYHQHHHHRCHHHVHKKTTPTGHLPTNIGTKSSLDFSDDSNHHRATSGGLVVSGFGDNGAAGDGDTKSIKNLQQIAVEIDAATMTEDNTTTATSNFAYRMPNDVEIGPIIRAPLHSDSYSDNAKRLCRKSSLNSSTTIETDELSNEEMGQSNGSYCCHHYNRCHCVKKNETRISVVQNERVKIKRKRFIAPTAEDYCSSCSRCSSCSCTQVRTSSCSSIDEWGRDGRRSFTSSDPRSRAFVVSADCHHCHVQYASTTSSADEVDESVPNATDKIQKDLQGKPLVHEATTVTDSSARSSRRSSITASFCSCNSTSCCYCSCSCGDSTPGQMCTAREITNTSFSARMYLADLEDQHSSTLTPLTNPSSLVTTPLAEDCDLTMRSVSNPITEDTSSQSQSAEYFSLSSSTQPSQPTPTATPTRKPTISLPPTVEVTEPASMEASNITRKSHKPCKHYSKHHRHKHEDTSVAIDVNALLQQTIRQSATLHEASMESKSWKPQRKHLREQTLSPPQSLNQTRLELSHGSNDSSSATLTSIVTIAKFPSQSAVGMFPATSATGSQQFPSVQSLAVSTMCGSNGGTVITTTASAPSSSRVKRTSKFSPVAPDSFSCDPLLFAAQERRSTEIIL